jgi:hypothetical protein
VSGKECSSARKWNPRIRASQARQYKQRLFSEERPTVEEKTRAKVDASSGREVFVDLRFVGLNKLGKKTMIDQKKKSELAGSPAAVFAPDVEHDAQAVND